MSNQIVFSVFVLFCAINGGFLLEIPNYIQICKREQATVNDCVKHSIEALRPKLAEGIPELKVPSIEPFYISELHVDSGDLVGFQAVGKDVKVFGASNFTIKSLNVDLETLTIKARVRFPKLHFDGKYKVDAKVLIVPLQGQGNIIADAVKCDADLTLLSELIQHDGATYIKFTKLDMDIKVKDYRLRLDGLFNGDKVLGDAANEAINQNRGEFLRSSKPILEKTVSRLLLDAANNIAENYNIDELFPKP